VRLSAFEFGNEINTAGYDGDFPARGSSRVLGIDDLNNPRDQEAAAITAGYRVYLKTLVELKKVRDGSKLNKATPIISAGLADPGDAGHRTGLKQPSVSIVATITFLRQNGIDNLVDGYGVHVYPLGDPKMRLSSRINNFDRDTFGACTAKKPCWLTEWGFSNNGQSCPVEDGTRVQLVHTLRDLFKHYAEQKRLAAVIYYSWTADPFAKELDPLSIYRCGGLTESGKLALSPM
jgi:hypothetical protein